MNKTILYKGATLHYQIKGEGPAVLLLHGFGENHKVWEKQLQILTSYKVLLPDLPGTGLSEMIPDMSLEGIADSLLMILESEKINTCVLLGHSMGGYIALAFAEKYSEKLSGFGLIHSSAYADTKEKIATRQKGIQFITEHGGNSFLKTSIPNLYSSETREKHPELIDSHIQFMTQSIDAALIAYYESMIQRPDRTAVLKTTSLPVFFAIGEFDNAVPMKDGLEQCHLPTLCFTHIFENVGHMGMMERPEEMNFQILDYLSFIYQS